MKQRRVEGRDHEGEAERLDDERPGPEQLLDHEPAQHHLRANNHFRRDGGQSKVNSMAEASKSEDSAKS